MQSIAAMSIGSTSIGKVKSNSSITTKHMTNLVGYSTDINKVSTDRKAMPITVKDSNVATRRISPGSQPTVSTWGLMGRTGRLSPGTLQSSEQHRSVAHQHPHCTLHQPVRHYREHKPTYERQHRFKRNLDQQRNQCPHRLIVNRNVNTISSTINETVSPSTTGRSTFQLRSSTGPSQPPTRSASRYNYPYPFITTVISIKDVTIACLINTNLLDNRNPNGAASIIINRIISSNVITSYSSVNIAYMINDRTPITISVPRSTPPAGPPRSPTSVTGPHAEHGSHLNQSQPHGTPFDDAEHDLKEPA
ncbi:hypothetical protein BDK51DRAFT_38183 [Blyttiomyces helicus]|uniref:Uncharacterized protein n=1 Tax=Blyttiomyces helicus TaxID=388810 RepID=A0A4P9WMQ1_9FUNG|nr:hypothetical protein BDK51DRAFT_38183 [Blyttiomyces helicus]|eukprot:RKO92958.1 hypothetical protein BDK51DRAFT_38183 [Blyttiomyces helicus]